MASTSKSATVSSSSQGLSSGSLTVDADLTRDAAEIQALSQSLGSQHDTEVVDKWGKQEMAIVLTEKEWDALSTGLASAILRKFKCSCETVLVLTAESQRGRSSFLACGFLELDSCKRASTHASSSCPLDADMMDCLGPLSHAPEAKLSKAQFLWTIARVSSFSETMQIEIPPSELGNKMVFHLPARRLQSCSAPSRGDLHETGEFFLRRLQPVYADRVWDVGQSLGGKEIRVGTSCSGSDICISVLRSTLQLISKDKGPDVETSYYVCTLIVCLGSSTIPCQALRMRGLVRTIPSALCTSGQLSPMKLNAIYSCSKTFCMCLATCPTLNNRRDFASSAAWQTERKELFLFFHISI